MTLRRHYSATLYRRCIDVNAALYVRHDVASTMFKRPLVVYISVSYSVISSHSRQVQAENDRKSFENIKKSKNVISQEIKIG